MKKYILTDINGNITNTYKLDGSVFVLPKEYDDITDHPDVDRIMEKPEKYKVEKKNNKQGLTIKVKNDRPTMVVEVVPDQGIQSSNTPVLDTKTLDNGV